MLSVFVLYLFCRILEIHFRKVYDSDGDLDLKISYSFIARRLPFKWCLSTARTIALLLDDSVFIEKHKHESETI